MSVTDANPLGLAWCLKCEEQCIPLRDGTCPWCDTATVTSSVPPTRKESPMASAHALTQTRDCTAPGCTNEANWTAGRYAGLCEEHAAAKRDATPPDGGGSRPAGATAAGGFEEKVKELGRLGRQVDKQHAKVEQAAVALRVARTEAADVEDRFRKLAAELVGSPS